MSSIDPNPRYAAAPYARVALSAQEWLLVSRSGERHVLTSEVLDALDQMRGFASLVAHRERLIEVMPQLAANSEQVMRVLQNLVQRGLLCAENERLGQLLAPREATVKPLLVVYFLGSRDPLPPLRALATELAGRETRILLIANDGASTDAQALASAAAPLPTVLLERARIQQWLHALGEQIVPGAGALAVSLAGSEANLAQLLGAGGQVLWLDDRLHLPLRSLGPPNPNWVLDEASSRQVQLYGAHREALAAGQNYPGGLGALLALCGQPLGALAQAGHRLDPTSLAGRSMDELEPLNADSRIRSVVAGTLGCAEGEHSLWMYFLDPRQREAWCASKAGYEQGLEAEALAHGLAVPRLQRGGAYRPLLLDASRTGGLVPGSGLHSERVLHALGSYLDPSSLVAQSDALIGRSTLLKRPRAQTNLDVVAPSLNAFVADQALMRRDEVVAQSAGARLELLAAVLRDHAASSGLQRRALLWEYLSFQQGQLIAALQQAIESAGSAAPRFWHVDLAQIVQNHGSALLGAKVARLAETPDDADQESAAADFSRLLEAAAAKLELWPQLWERARSSPLL